MMHVGWAVSVIAALGGGAVVLGYVLDQISVLSRKLIKTIRALHALIDEIRRPSAVHLPLDPTTPQESTGRSHVGGPSR